MRQSEVIQLRKQMNVKWVKSNTTHLALCTQQFILLAEINAQYNILHCADASIYTPYGEYLLSLAVYAIIHQSEMVRLQRMAHHRVGQGMCLSGHQGMEEIDIHCSGNCHVIFIVMIIRQQHSKNMQCVCGCMCECVCLCAQVQVTCG